MNMNSVMVRIKLYRRALALGDDKPSSQTRKERFLVCDVQGEVLMVGHGFYFIKQGSDKVPSLGSAASAVERGGGGGSSWWHLLRR